MTTEEFSDAFDTLVNSAANVDNFGSIDSTLKFDEYEKSYFLTKAQEEVVRELYTGKNRFGESFEKTEELRRLLNDLIVTHKQPLSEENYNDLALTDKSYLVPILDDVMYIIYEAVRLKDDSLGCYSGIVINVQPITHDEYNKIKDNPFRGPTRYKALRLDTNDTKITGEDVQSTNYVEIISKYSCDEYIVRYLRKLNPIILVDLEDSNVSIDGHTDKQDCELNSILHEYILERAVDMALRTKSIGKPQNV
jgi:hypothetical protein